MRRKIVDAIKCVTSGMPKKDAHSMPLRTPVVAVSKPWSINKAGTKHIRTNRRGLFTWDRWNGNLWETKTLDVYQQSEFYYMNRRTQTLLRAAQDRRASCLIRSSDDFWVTYYLAVDLANRKIESLMLLLTDMNVIQFLTRTAPYKLAKRCMETTRAMDLAVYALRIDARRLHNIQTTIVHVAHNPLYLKAWVHRDRVNLVASLTFVDDTLAAKQYRMQGKASSELYRYSSYRDTKILHPKTRWVKPREGLQDVFLSSLDTTSPRWPIESFTSCLNLTLLRVRMTLKAVDEMQPVSLRVLVQSDWFRLQVHLARIGRTSSELHLLKTELVGVGYYDTKTI
jgi:hypothetical protein